MAFRAGRTAAFYIGTTNLSAYLDSIDFPISVGTSDTTTFGSAWTTGIVTLNSATISISGGYDPTASTGPAATLQSMISGGTAWPFAHFPGGSVSGQRTRTGSCFITSYTETSAAADKVVFAAEFMVTGTVTSGTVS